MSTTQLDPDFYIPADTSMSENPYDTGAAEEANMQSEGPVYRLRSGAGHESHRSVVQPPQVSDGDS